MDDEGTGDAREGGTELRRMCIRSRVARAREAQQADEPSSYALPMRSTMARSATSGTSAEVVG